MFSNLWISFGAVGLALNYYLFNHLTVNKNGLLFVFFATFFSYNFQRLLKIKLNINLIGERVEWIMTHKKIIELLTVVAFIGSVFFGYELIIELWWLLLVIGLLTFFYVWKIPGLNGKSLRDIPTLKIFIIGFVWVLFCVLFLNRIENNGKIIPQLIFQGILTFVFIISITIPFDVRDMNLDAQSTKTIPQLIGEKKATYLSVVLFLLSQVGLIYLYPQHLYGLLIFMAIGSWVLIQSKNKNKELYFSGLVDGLLVLQTCFIVLNI